MITSGLDVHKDSVFCATSNGNSCGDVIQYGNFTSDMKAMVDRIKSIGIESIEMESTGIYWIPIWNILEKNEFLFILVNPFLIKLSLQKDRSLNDSLRVERL